MVVKRCYILGAGFSKACGLPLASKLTSQVFAHAYPPNFWHAKNREAYRKYLLTLYPNCDLENDQIDFEDLITVLEEWDEYRIAYGGRDSSVAHLKDVLLKHLGLLLCEKAAQAYSSCALEPVREFLLKVREERSSLISFNWDLLIEIAAHDLGLLVTYSDTAAGEIRLAKPHGSLNLAEVKKERYEQMERSINVHGLDIEWEQGDTVVVRARDPRDAANRIVYPFENALLVEPTARKSYASKWIELQWRRALDIVRTADEIIVIGYSLPDTDIRPRILLQLAGLDRNGPIQLKLIDRKAKKILDRYKRFVSFSIEPIEARWEEANSILESRITR